VSVGNWLFPDDVQFPGECIAGNQTYHGGDGGYVGSNSTWIHSLHVINVGIGVGGLCESIRSVDAAYRAAYDGYFDCYNDWGFSGNYGCGTLTLEYGPY
jgi:hypothetical protein